MRRSLDRFVGVACRFLLAIFFRRVEVVGRDHLPEGVPRIVVANHVNALVDPLFILGPLGLPVRMLAKSTLWRIPGIGWLLDLAGAVPVHRPFDPGVDPSRNAETFDRCHRELAAGASLALFPEGVSHDDPALRPLRTGAARIALEAEERFGPLGIRIVPVGLVFEDRTRFRSRALVVVGEPIDPQAATRNVATSAEPADPVRALTRHIAEGLERVTLNYESWADARRIELGARVWHRDRHDLPRQRDLAADFAMRRALSGGLEALRQRHPEEVTEALTAVRAYEALLRATGVADEQVAARWRPATTLAVGLRTLARLLIAAPVAVVGTLLNLVPWLAVRSVARLLRHQPNQVATYKVFPALVLYPLCWALQGWLAATRLPFGDWIGWAAALLALPTGWVAMRWHERRAALWSHGRAFLLFASRRPVALELRARRIRVEEAIDRLVARWRELQASPDSIASRRA